MKILGITNEPPPRLKRRPQYRSKLLPVLNALVKLRRSQGLWCELTQTEKTCVLARCYIQGMMVQTRKNNDGTTTLWLVRKNGVAKIRESRR